MHPEIERLIKERQDLEPILKFYDLVLDRQEKSRPDDLSLLIDIRGDSIRDELANGNPLIDPSKTALLDLQNSIALFYAIVELLVGASDLFGDLAGDIEARLKTGQIDIGEAMRHALGSDQEGLRRSAEGLGLSGEALYFLVGLSLTPSLRLLSLKVKEGFDVAWWDEPFCPVCGQLPNMAQVLEDGRQLYCSFCFMEWRYTVSGCLLCGKDDKKMVGTLQIKGEAGYRLSICGNCNGYIKVIDKRYLPEDLDSRIIDLISLPLDIIARQKGHKGPATFPI